jgi:hypothetical protein
VCVCWHRPSSPHQRLLPCSRGAFAAGIFAAAECGQLIQLYEAACVGNALVGNDIIVVSFLLLKVCTAYVLCMVRPGVAVALAFQLLRV